MKKYSLIILPGWGGNYETWRDFIKLITEYFDKIKVIELPCFGASPCPSTAWGVEEYSEYARAEIEKLHFENLALLGHSFGGQVAVKFISEHPENVKKLILSGPAVFRPSFSFRRFFFGLLVKFGKKLFELPLVEKGSVFAKKLLYNKIIRSRDYLESAGMKREIFKKIIRQDLRHLLPNIKTPALILWGKKDNFVPVKDGKKMAKMMPNSYLHIFKKGGHGLHIYNKDEMILVIQHFLYGERY